VEKDPNYPSPLRFLYKLSKPFLKSPEKGTETSIYLASSSEVEGVTGKYFVNKKEAKSSKVSYDESVSKRLWEVSLELTKLHEDDLQTRSSPSVGLDVTPCGLFYPGLCDFVGVSIPTGCFRAGSA